SIRAVLGEERPKVCFSAGHGEVTSDPLREHLARSGYAIASLGGPDGDPGDLAGCNVLVVAGPAEKVPAADVARYQAYVEAGGGDGRVLRVGEDRGAGRGRRRRPEGAARDRVRDGAAEIGRGARRPDRGRRIGRRDDGRELAERRAARHGALRRGRDRVARG